MAEYWYNTAYHNSSGLRPFKVVYGRDPPHLVKYVPEDPIVVKTSSIQKNVVLGKLNRNLNKPQDHMKKYAEERRKYFEFQVGNIVLVKLQPYQKHSVVLMKNKKLSEVFLDLSSLGENSCLKITVAPMQQKYTMFLTVCS